MQRFLYTGLQTLDVLTRKTISNTLSSKMDLGGLDIIAFVYSKP